MKGVFINFSELTKIQKDQYDQGIAVAFPPIIAESKVIKKNWAKLERYFAKYQLFLLSEDGDLVGFMNVVPFRFDKPLTELPDRGWDWMFEKGVSDYENSIQPNYLGGLQVIVRKKYQKRGYSKIILKQAKTLSKSFNLSQLIIPIRPTRKHEFPSMTMSEYIDKQEGGKIFDPWIRTHVASGAKILKFCYRSMIMSGDILFWESILKQKIHQSGKYQLERALTLITIDVEANEGHYIEPNVWIAYD